jgi:hypothetical protein
MVSKMLQEINWTSQLPYCRGYTQNSYGSRHCLQKREPKLPLVLISLVKV